MNNSQKDLGLLELIDLIWSARTRILKITILVVILGTIYSFLVPIQYQVKTTMISNQEQSGNLGGNLGGLASLAGINLGDKGGGNTITPALYPKITSSVPFRKAVLETELKFSDLMEPIQFKDYIRNHSEKNALGYIKQYTIGLPGLIRESLSNSTESKGGFSQDDELIVVSRDEMEMIESLEDRIITSVDDELGLITITVRLSEALATAQLAVSVQNHLQKEVTAYRIAKAQETLDFTNKLFNEKKSLFEMRQKELAKFQDRNVGLTTSSARAELERLQADYDLSLTVYNEVAKQLESAKIQVVKDTPSFTVIEPVVVPTLRKKPLRTLIMIGSGFLGVFVGIGLVFLQAYIQELKAEGAKKST